jgi:hypothetical protein
MIPRMPYIASLYGFPEGAAKGSSEPDINTSNTMIGYSFLQMELRQAKMNAPRQHLGCSIYLLR